MFCKKCGKEIESGMRFCKNCGEPVEGVGKASGSTAGTWRGPAVLCIRIGLIVSALLLALSTVLPYLVFGRDIARMTGIESISLLLTDGSKPGDGILYILLALVIIVFTCIKIRIPALICSALSILLCWFEKSQFNKAYAEALGKTKIDMWDFVEKGSGYHLLTVSIILLTVLSILYLFLGKKEGKK